MPELDSDLEGAGIFQLIPNSVQNGHVVAVDDVDEQGNFKLTKAGAPRVNLDWEIDEGEFAGRKIRFDMIILGGKSAKGDAISLSRLCSFLHFTGVPWTCKKCGTKHTEKKSFLIAKKEDKETSGLTPGNYYCPSCKDPKPAIKYDTSDFMSARCGLSIGSKKQDGSDKEFNEIKAYTDLK
jgi:hypothetical protein